MSVSIGIAGCGAITETYYAPALRSIEAAGLAKVVSLFDPSADRLNVVGELLPGARRHNSFDQLIEAKPELAIIASPPKFHAAQSIAMLQAGSLVLCEKPMATTVAEAEEMLKAARHNRLAVGLFRRFFPAAQLIRDYISAETLGKPIDFEFTEGGAFNWPAQSASFFQKSSAHGGVFFDLGVHLLDLALWWLGEPDAIDYQDDAMGGLEINSVLRLDYANGLKGVVHLSHDWDLPNRYLIHCERGWLAWRVGEANQVEIGVNSAGEGLALHGHVHPSHRTQLSTPGANYPESFVLQLLNCINAITSNESLHVPGEEGIRSLRLIERCYQDRKLLLSPWFNEDETRRARALAAV